MEPGQGSPIPRPAENITQSSPLEPGAREELGALRLDLTQLHLVLEGLSLGEETAIRLTSNCI